MRHFKIGRRVVAIAIVFIFSFTVSVSADEAKKGDFSFYKSSAETDAYAPIKGGEVRNVILLIGDGMGTGPVALARMRAAWPDGKLYMERMPVAGFVRTHSADAVVTDSAAAATAMATGFRTNNGMISVSPEGRKLLTILEAARDKGMATGLVATSTITHATPAGFGAHNISRNNQAEIAEDLLANRVNVILGGGREYFLPKSRAGSKREDERDLTGEAMGGGYVYIETGERLAEAEGDYVLGLFADGALATEEPEPSLAELTEKAIEILSEKKRGLFKRYKGFFLMVEGSQIDWACHGNDADGAVRQVLLFDMAVKAAVEFAARDKHTLVIVTADHDTGGLVIVAGEGGEPGLSWATKSHTALSVPVFAYGPGAEAFGGTCDNADIARRMGGALGLKGFPAIAE